MQGSVTKDEIENVDQNENGPKERMIRGWEQEECGKYMPIITLIYPIWIWTCARYHYRPTFNFLMHNIVIVTEPMTYFYSLLIRPGTCMSTGPHCPLVLKTGIWGHRYDNFFV